MVVGLGGWLCVELWFGYGFVGVVEWVVGLGGVVVELVE